MKHTILCFFLCIYAISLYAVQPIPVYVQPGMVGDVADDDFDFGQLPEPAFIGPASTADEADRVLVYGGSFDPPHLGHMATIVLSLIEKSVDEVWLVVSPPRADKQQRTSLAQRTKWAVDVSEYMRERGLKVYVTDAEQKLFEANGKIMRGTYYLMKYLQFFAPGVDLGFMVGEDSWATLSTDVWADSLKPEIRTGLKMMKDFFILVAQRSSIARESLIKKLNSEALELNVPSPTLIPNPKEDAVLEKIKAFFPWAADLSSLETFSSTKIRKSIVNADFCSDIQTLSTFSFGLLDSIRADICGNRYYQ